MTIKNCFIAIGILCVALFAAIIITTWNKHVLVLTNGEMIEADRIWHIFDTVYYEQGEDTLFTVKKTDVDEIYSASLSSLDDWQSILALEMEQRKGIFSVLLYKTAVAGVLLTFCVFVAASLIRRFAALKSRKRKDKSPHDDDEPIEINIDPATSDMQKIVLYFLNLYLLQLKTKQKDHYRFIRLDTKGPRKTTVFSLQKRVGNRWQSRRMSLGPIGEESGL